MELKNFQLKAIAALKDAMNDDNEVVLKSPTGSGKTIMLTHFMDEYCKSTPNTVFVWLTPGKGNLEEQSKAKMDRYIHNAQTKLLADVMTSGFAENDCCFINWELLTKKGNNALKEGERKNFLEHIETAQNNGLQFKIIVDESHLNDSVKANEILEFFKSSKIIKSSATPKGYDAKHTTVVEVDESDVVAEGLIKTLLVVNEDIPQNTEVASQIACLIGKSLEKQRKLFAAYKQYNSNVNPLIIVQLPNNDDVLLDAVERYFESNLITYENKKLAIWLSNKKENLEGIEKNDAEAIAVIIKQAVATGWDCPRAHILVKLRGNMGETFEIQTIGRIRRMAEAKHYNDELLDRCYLYTFDEKFTEGVQTTLGKGALKAITLFLKKQYKDITLKAQYKKNLEFFGGGRNGTNMLKIIHAFYKKKYHIDNNYNQNKKRLEQGGYIFSKDNSILIRTAQGETTNISASGINKLNDLWIKEKSNTHEHGRLFHHYVANIGLKIGISYDQMNLLIRRLFGEINKTPKILSLPIKTLYAFVINNEDKLRHDIQDSMSEDLKQLAMPDDEQITEFDFKMPQSILFTYNERAKDQSIMEKNVYKGYLASAEPRSSSEKMFEKYCEMAKSIKWIYKNGDKGNEYFSLVYKDNIGKLKSFYPDYLIGTEKEGIWVIETKGGFDRSGKSEDIDKFSPKKFEVLKAYLDKYKLKGGFVREDKRSQELCICMEHYSDDIESDDWKLLKEILK